MVVKRTALFLEVASSTKRICIINRERFFKFLLGLPFGTLLATKVQQRSQEYLLNKFYVAGFQYYDGPVLIDDIKVGEALSLVAVPTNKYDNFAVEVYNDATLLGHIPRTDNKHISRLLQQGVSLNCYVVEANVKQQPWKMLKVEVYL